jgi:glycosyltransferase involved in cell wall biosynthesis
VLIKGGIGNKMSNYIVGVMWNKNEGDILEEIIEAALPHVDSLFIADDGSKDSSWSTIQYLAGVKDKIEHTQQAPNPGDPAQRQALLDEIRRRYKPEDTWVQVIESDIMLLDTNVREAIKNHADSHNLAVSWQCLNGVRKVGTWKGEDTYPNWNKSITEVLPYAHWMEVMTYTFRPLPKLHYTMRWRPWPSGWSHYSNDKVKNARKSPDSPLLAHYGYRGPTHFHKKYKHMGDYHTKYKNWHLTSPGAIEESVPFFNGKWNGNPFPMSREGWQLRWAS